MEAVQCTVQWQVTWQVLVKFRDEILKLTVIKSVHADVVDHFHHGLHGVI